MVVPPKTSQTTSLKIDLAACKTLAIRGIEQNELPWHITRLKKSSQHHSHTAGTGTSTRALQAPCQAPLQQLARTAARVTRGPYKQPASPADSGARTHSGTPRDKHGRHAPHAARRPQGRAPLRHRTSMFVQFPSLGGVRHVRRHALPPPHAGLHGPGRRPGRHGERRPIDLGRHVF